MSILFDNFGFRALWTPELAVPLIIIGFVYFKLIRNWEKHEEGAPATIKQKLSFVGALMALYIGWGSPLYIAGHIMITFHMIQMVFAYFIAVPLFLLGIPSWMFKTVIKKCKKPFIAKVFRLFWNPIVALFLFNGLFSLYHVPLMFDTLMQSVFLHSFYQMILFLASTLMWWHMIAPIPSLSNLSHLKRIGYIFANGILITPACALIIFAASPLYQTYTNPDIWANVMAYCLPAGTDIPTGLLSGPNSFVFLEKRMDQQLAGVLMKVMQEVMYGTTIGFVFKQWLSEEKQQDGELSISDVSTTVPRRI